MISLREVAEPAPLVVGVSGAAQDLPRGDGLRQLAGTPQEVRHGKQVIDVFLGDSVIDEM